MFASFGLIAVLGTLALGLLVMALSSVRAAESFESRMLAFHLADGAIDETITALRADTNFTGVPQRQVSVGSYQSVVTQSPEDPNIYQIHSTGIFGSDADAFGFQQRMIDAIVSLEPQSLFDFGVFADSDIIMNGGAKTDSYNSSEGDYKPNAAGSEGNIGTNLTAEGAIRLSGNVIVNGDAVVGPHSDVETAVTMTGSSTVTGSVVALSAPKDLPPVSIPDGLDCESSLTAASDEVIALDGGSYCFSSISITASARLEFSGSADVYVQGDVTFAGQSAGSAQALPADFHLWVQGDHTVKIAGGGTFYGAVYAPDSLFKIDGNGELFGAVIADTIHASGSGVYDGTIHYDEAMNDESNSEASTVTLLSWQEL